MNTPQIDVIYAATTPLGDDLAKVVGALQTQVDRDFAPCWGLSCKLDIQTAPRAGVWRLIFLDDADQADALGYHELTPDGLPQGKVFVRTTLKDKQKPTVTASHELLEMLGDPKIDQVAQRFFVDRTYALENCDAVEEFEYLIDGISVSNFQLPRWFGMSISSLVGASRAQGAFDFMGKCGRPWQILPGGYMSIKEDGGWSQVFASVRGASAFHADSKWRAQTRESGVKRTSLR